MKSQHPEPIPLKLTHQGYTLTQIKREGMVCIYLKSKPGHSHDHYEVVKLGIGKPFTIKGKSYPLRETYPKDEDWGISVFTANTMGQAMIQFKSLQATQEPVEGEAIPLL